MRPLALLSLLTKGLTSPTTIAAVASVGMHTALGVALPTIPFFSEETFLPESTPSPTKQVGMVELSAQDASRLPLSVIAPSPVLSSLPGARDYRLPSLDELPKVNSSTKRSSSATTRPSRSSQGSGRAAQLPPPVSSRSLPQPSSSYSRWGSGVNVRTRQRTNTSGTSRQQQSRREAESFPINQPRDQVLSIDEAARGQNLVSINNTTPEAVKQNETDWLAQNPNRAVDPLVFRYQGTYPAVACAQSHSGTSIYGVTIQANGRATGFTLIKSAGLGILDRQARSLISRRPFESVEQLTPAKIEVTFTPDPAVCPGLTTAESTTADPDQEAASLTSPGETSEATPAASPSPTTTQPTPSEATQESTPGLAPDADSELTPAGVPNPEASPAASPEATPDTPTDSGSESTPAVVPSPESSPEPTPESTPAAAPSPKPSPTPAIAPSPSPESTPAAAPAPSPSPTPEATPRPLPQPQPAPESLNLDTAPQPVPYGDGADALKGAAIARPKDSETRAQGQ